MEQSFKANIYPKPPWKKKLMISMLKHQIFCFWWKSDSLTQLSTQKIKCSKIQFFHVLVFMVEYSHSKNQINLLLSSRENRLTDWHTDMRMDESNEIDFICIHSAMPGVQLTNFSHCISLQSSSSYMFEVVLIMSVNFERLRPCRVNIIIYRVRKNKQNCLKKSLICWLLMSVKKIFGYCNKSFLIQNHRVTED